MCAEQLELCLLVAFVESDVLDKLVRNAMKMAAVVVVDPIAEDLISSVQLLKQKKVLSIKTDIKKVIKNTWRLSCRWHRR